MMKPFLRSKKFVFLSIALLLIVVGTSCMAFLWDGRYPSGSWHYKMTVEVQTPEGIKTGSAVREVDAYRAPRIFPEDPGGHAGCKGEAVAVNLGKRGILFALLRGNKYGADYAWQIVFDSFPFSGGGLTAEGIRHYRNLKSGEKTLEPNVYPMLVTFGNLSDPKTVKLVDPNNLAASFGVGVSLKSITIKIVHEPVTRDKKEWLPWISNFYNKMLDGNSIESIRASNHLANSLSSGSFSSLENRYDR